MREICFRAWDKEREIMIGSDFPGNWGNDNDEYYSDIRRIQLQSIENISSNERFNVMQFTGLKDKNGKKIYEGDILSYPSGEGRGQMIIRNFIQDTYHAGNLSEIEIIGNIYENKELLK